MPDQQNSSGDSAEGEDGTEAGSNVELIASVVDQCREALGQQRIEPRPERNDVESVFRHLMRVAISVREGAISSSTLLKRLRSGSRKNATYTEFREAGRVIRTVQLLRYLSDAPLRRRVTAATNKVESFNRFSPWFGFGNRGVIADNDPVEQETAMKFNALLTNAVIFHNALDIAEIVRQLLEEVWEIDPEELARISPYLTEHINRFGEYSTHELGIQPGPYDPKLDVDFTLLREQDLAAAGFGTAA
ncbi:Tn3 family transposase [Streptomyces sp. NPDC046197]|uniref:Tn3 family transposase n=1 Tax=Streptomyces sp. NPDC046197 TaxID=3154337 RepID=UPI0033DD47B4